MHNAPESKKIFFILITVFSLAAASYAAPADQLGARVYKMNPETFLAHLKQLLPPKPNESVYDLILRLFKLKGVEIKPPDVVFLADKRGEIYVRAPQKEQDIIRSVILMINDFGKGA